LNVTNDKRQDAFAGSKTRANAVQFSSDLPNKVEAINRALQSWNDQEVLRLLRLHWREIARFVTARAAG
jgi:hypothetical protein